MRLVNPQETKSYPLLYCDSLVGSSETTRDTSKQKSIFVR
jgi:hypothetical protein